MSILVQKEDFNLSDELKLLKTGDGMQELSLVLLVSCEGIVLLKHWN